MVYLNLSVEILCLNHKREEAVRCLRCMFIKDIRKAST